MDRHVGKGLAMTRVVFYHEGNEEIVVLTLSLRGGRQDDAAIHRVSGDVGGNCGLLIFPLSLFTLQSSLFHLLVHSGSPRAFSPRDDKSDVGA